MKKNIILSFVIALILGCAGSMQKISFDMNLDQVERPKDAKERFGEINTTVVDSLGKQYLNFEDDLIKAQFLFGYSQIGLLLENKSEHTMKINWDNAAWISPSGNSSRVIHSGVRLMDRNSPQSPSVVVRNGKLSDIIIPSDNIYFESGQYGGWRYLGLIHHTSVMTMDMQAELSKAKSQVGKTCGVLLPIEIEGVQNDYIFTFAIGEATIKDRY
ncbi:hypothetical protein HOE22_03965 [Candidatus Woesearchaeota archaeon]|jgi:hypothetical protein|nr:hypothetical protein [Candidatus Neomarinimicrobiota bacterium]MBT4207481.1 hypothetical protein [Candidatus Woesearchaeota archaeon]MBT7786996.1 hypothetical protein [Candidatus Woesearchaeota archaeon]MBT7900664.1 hypothetical protein [Candidatus Neomarinimicrobiota bacterium]